MGTRGSGMAGGGLRGAVRALRERFVLRGGGEGEVASRSTEAFWVWIVPTPGESLEA